MVHKEPTGRLPRIPDTEEPNYVKSTFKVKLNQRLSFPLEKYPEMYLHYYKPIDVNNSPFKVNDDFAEYQEIFCSGINREIVRVYKSLFSTNNFLLFPQRYYITRNADQACIDSTMFLTEEGVSEEEQTVSKVGFSFSIAPALSRFELAKLKLKLIENGIIDDELSVIKSKKSYFDRIRLNFPNDIGAEVSTNGDQFLATADITQDGMYFDMICETEDLAEAGRFISGMNSGSERSFNIVSTYKDIYNSAVVELDLDKTIGDFLTLEVEDDEIVAHNKSYSPCRISNIMLLNEEGEAFYNSRYFKNKEDLSSGEKLTIRITDLTDKESFMHPKEVFAEYESIEDYGKEFGQEIDQLTSYYQKVVLNLSNIDDEEVEAMQIDIKHVSTGSLYPFRRERAQFEQPILLTIISKYEREPITQLEILRTYYDQNENIIRQDTLNWDYSKGTLIDLSLSEQEE